MSAGRKTKYTPDTVKAITDALRIGGTIGDACYRAGITYQTFERWSAAHVEFVDAVQKALADCKLAKIARIEAAGRKGTWQADAWYLERRFPDEYGQKLTVRLTPEQAAALSRIGVSAGDVLEQFIQEVQRADA